MAFNSLIYLFFLIITALLYYLLPEKLRWVWLLIASFGYYLSFVPFFITIIIVMVTLNFFLAKLLASIKKKGTNITFIIIILINLLILVFFKYFNFFFENNHIHLYSFDFFFRTNPINSMILPIGLSYLTFTLLSYQIEVKKKNIYPEKHFGYFSLYLIFFPRIAQGPIERPQHLLPQLRKVQSFIYSNVTEGLKLIIWGYFKKLVIADRLAIYVNSVYNNSEQHSGITLAVATIFFAFQIYTDFSSYTDIAIGSAKIFGINLTNNFKRPYFATTIKEFWNRWHITFSTWLRDYIFLPIAYYLSKKMKKERYLLISAENWIYFISIIITFALCGIWHGEGFNFLIWGLIFGVYLTYSQWSIKWNKMFRKRFNINKSNHYYQFFKIITTFLFVSFAWVFFRANTVNEAFIIIKKISTFSRPFFYESPSIMIYSIFGILFIFLKEFKDEYYKGHFSLFQNKNWILSSLSYVFLIIIILLIGVFDGGQFIYFQF
jgi:alginate O-acetyltransferase complex protein AlgI